MPTATRAAHGAAGHLRDDRPRGRPPRRGGGTRTRPFSSFALHGMGPNTCHTADPRRDGAGGSWPRPRNGARRRGRSDGALKRLRGMVPLSVRNEVKRRLPDGTAGPAHLLLAHGRAGLVDAPALSARSPICRATCGSTSAAARRKESWSPGTSTRPCARRSPRVCTSFVDADTGEPLVRNVWRADEIFPPGPRRDDLPDLLVDWTPTSVLTRRGVPFASVRDDRVAESRRSTRRPDRQPPHRGVGDRARETGSCPAERLEGDILDLAPTALALLGLARFPRDAGTALVAARAGAEAAGEPDEDPHRPRAGRLGRARPEARRVTSSSSCWRGTSTKPGWGSSSSRPRRRRCSRCRPSWGRRSTWSGPPRRDPDERGDGAVSRADAAAAR